MSFRVEYKRGGTGPTMFQRHVRIQVDINTICKQGDVGDMLFAITFTLISGNIRRFRRICEHIQAQVCSKRYPALSSPTNQHNNKVTNSVAESISCGSDSSDRINYNKHVSRDLASGKNLLLLGRTCLLQMSDRKLAVPPSSTNRSSSFRGSMWV